MIELVEVKYLPERLKQDTRGRRPWEVNPENVEQVRRLFPKWLKERHGIVVYECVAMDSSALGNRSFMPRMFEAQDDKFHPAPNVRSPTGNASDQEWPVDWISMDQTFDGWTGLPPEDILDRCFFYEEDGVRKHLMTASPWQLMEEGE